MIPHIHSPSLSLHIVPSTVASKTTYQKEQGELIKLRELLEKRRAEVNLATKLKEEERQKEAAEAELSKKAAEIELARLAKEKPTTLEAEADAKAEIARRQAELKAEQEERERDAKRLQKEQKELSKLEVQLNELLSDIAQEVDKLAPPAGIPLDLDRDGKVSLDEMLHAVKLTNPDLPDQAIREIVERLDADHDGVITLEEVLQRLKSHEHEEEDGTTHTSSSSGSSSSSPSTTTPTSSK